MNTPMFKYSKGRCTCYMLHRTTFIYYPPEVSSMLFWSIYEGILQAPH